MIRSLRSRSSGRPAAVVGSWLLTGSLLHGCLLYVAKAPSSVDPDCVSDLCEGGYSCDLEEDQCADRCSDDTGFSSSPPCQAGFTCWLGDCEETCDDDDCDRGFTCDPVMNECRDYCFDNDDCADEFRCCTSNRYINGECDDSGDCYRP